MRRIASFTLSALLSASAVAFVVSNSDSAFAHEKAFPTRQLGAVTPSGMNVTFKETAVKPDATKLAAFEKKHGVKFGKGDLAGSLFLGAGADKKVQIVALFLDGKSDRGDTEFGASVTPQGRISQVKAFSSPESGDATSDAFLSSLVGKSADELDALRKELAKDASKAFITELALKAVGRVEASFSKK
jgi:hypothetical protein